MQRKMKIRVINFLIPVFLFVAISCNQSESPDDTPTTGQITISADETLKLLVESEVDTFNKIYQYAKVTVNFKPEADVFNDLMNGDIRLIITARNLNKEELEQFNKWEIVPKITKIAYDAIAIISSKDVQDSTVTINELTDLLSGTNVPSFKNTKIIFDNSNSSTIRFIKEKTGVKDLSKNCFALNSNTAVIDYVSTEKNCIGVIGVNWISDRDDTTHMNFLNSFKVMELESNVKGEFFKPYQAYIAQKIYPLWREIYILSKEAYTGLGTGFTAFVASERGQRIVLKFGLVPATMPVRLVELIENEDLYIKHD